MNDVESAIADAFREHWGRIVATLIRVTGDWDLAEEAAQEAFASAVHAWRRDGVPERPRAWLITTARNRAVDRVRRDRVGAAKIRELVAGFASDGVSAADEPTIPDDRLRLIFTCCHPALTFEAQVALALRTLCGLSTADIAQVFLVSEATIAKRLVRAKQKIALAGIPYRVPADEQLPRRLTAVLSVIYLLFHDGYAALTRPEPCRRAVELSELVADLMPAEPEALGLNALLLFIHARAATRVDADGTLVPLEEQDRARWDRPMIARGLTRIRAALRHERVGPYQLQALIAASHAIAPSAADTDWPSIAALYDDLIDHVPSTTVRLNRAVAVAMSAGPEAGLALLDDVADHPLRPAVRADLLRRLGRRAEAAAAYREAIGRAAAPGARAYLSRRLAEVSGTRREPIGPDPRL